MLIRSVSIAVGTMSRGQFDYGFESQFRDFIGQTIRPRKFFGQISVAPCFMVAFWYYVSSDREGVLNCSWYSPYTAEDGQQLTLLLVCCLFVVRVLPASFFLCLFLFKSCHEQASEAMSVRGSQFRISLQFVV